MRKYLYSTIQWSDIKVVGFDMDGTLYDEFEFITQVYDPISKYLCEWSTDKTEEIYNKMLLRWYEKGSSYNKIFEEIIAEYLPESKLSSEIVKNCLEIFYDYKPRLKINQFVQEILSEMKENYAIFLVTDGNAKLQRSKFDALELNRWFINENLGFCGKFKANYAKPSIHILKELDVFRDNNKVLRSDIVYFGDRKVDFDFAINCGFKFVQVNCMLPTFDTLKYD